MGTWAHTWACLLLQTQSGSPGKSGGPKEGRAESPERASRSSPAGRLMDLPRKARGWLCPTCSAPLPTSPQPLLRDGESIGPREHCLTTRGSPRHPGRAIHLVSADAPVLRAATARYCPHLPNCRGPSPPPPLQAGAGTERAALVDLETQENRKGPFFLG